MKSFVSALIAATAVADNSDHWAVIVAGSRRIWNYRH
jgi:glycosylphosphatidylinositol transamidase (GPIT) subunit GPI8